MHLLFVTFVYGAAVQKIKCEDPENKLKDDPTYQCIHQDGGKTIMFGMDAESAYWNIFTQPDSPENNAWLATGYGMEQMKNLTVLIAQVDDYTLEELEKAKGTGEPAMIDPTKLEFGGIRVINGYPSGDLQETIAKVDEKKQSEVTFHRVTSTFGRGWNITMVVKKNVFEKNNNQIMIAFGEEDGSGRKIKAHSPQNKRKLEFTDVPEPKEGNVWKDAQEKNIASGPSFMLCLLLELF